MNFVINKKPVCQVYRRVTNTAWKVNAMTATVGVLWGQYWRWWLMKVARSQRFGAAAGREEDNLWEERGRKERKPLLCSVNSAKLQLLISSVCLRKPWALAMCSCAHRDAICPSAHTGAQARAPLKTDCGCLADKLSTFVHWRNFYWATGSSVCLLLFPIHLFPPLSPSLSLSVGR